ncbi:Protein of unknown function [Gryllus bimaculatus]|nr:Protein of unknown function [Gryllus bimaculatus]
MQLLNDVTVSMKDHRGRHLDAKDKRRHSTSREEEPTSDVQQWTARRGRCVLADGSGGGQPSDLDLVHCVCNS